MYAFSDYQIQSSPDVSMATSEFSLVPTLHMPSLIRPSGTVPFTSFAVRYEDALVNVAGLDG